MDNIDEHVQAGLDAGMSARAIAAELDVERGRVDRVVKRLKRHARALDAAEQEAESPSSLQQQIARLDEQIAAATESGNDMRALRLTRVRAALVKQLPVEEEATPDAADMSLLTDTERSAFDYLIRRVHGADANPWWAECFARIPANVEELHPSRVPLPAGAPEGVRYVLPEAT